MLCIHYLKAHARFGAREMIKNQGRYYEANLYSYLFCTWNI